MPLQEYRKKRKFNETPEPRGGSNRKGKGSRIFIVQKHDASRLHYDFRLEIHGELVSWAVPKGPSLNPSDKRLAIRTEDHPIEYGDFEGVIPEGHYGAGTVMVWDKGTYDPEEQVSPEKQLTNGELKVVLHGKKLRGAFVLLRPSKRAIGRREQERWLLLKRRDQYADPAWRIDDPALDRSVITGRTLNEIRDGRTARNLASAE